MLTQNVAELLQKHVVFSIESIDRLYLNGYVQGLQTPGAVAAFIKNRLGYPIASTTVLSPLSRDFVKSVEDFAQLTGIDIVPFEKGQRKDDVAKKYLAEFKGEEGILFLGKAQEKAKVFRTCRQKNPKTGKFGPWIYRGSALVNHDYFYILDKDFGPMFIKFCSYFPYPMKVCLNGHEWAKCQLKHEGIDYEPLDNGFLSCENPERLQQICTGLEPLWIEKAIVRWLSVLPNPYRVIESLSGYHYEYSVIQAEFSLTQVFDRPLSGRPFFEEVIRENLDLGRPDQVSLVFGRRVTKKTPGLFRTRVVTHGVSVSVNIQYKHSKLKQYFKENRALRTEMTINDTYDFRIGRRLKNLPLLKEIGFSANRRLLDVQRVSHDCFVGVERFNEISHPQRTETGQRASALRFGEERAMALMNALNMFCLLPNGFRNKDMRAHVAPLLGEDPAQYRPGKMTYDLRRLRLHGLIERVEGTHTYQVTDEGTLAGTFYSRTYARVFRQGFSVDTQKVGPHSRRNPRHRAFTKLEEAVDRFLDASRIPG